MKANISTILSLLLPLTGIVFLSQAPAAQPPSGSKGLTADTTPPALQQILVLASNDVRLVFSEAVSATSAQKPSNYGLSGQVQAAGLSSNGKMVGLSTIPMDGTPISLVISNISDLAGNIMPPVVTNITYPDPALELWLKMDETPGTTALDSSKSKMNATVESTAWTNGHTGTGLKFDASATYSRVYGPSFSYGSQFSISFWFKCAANAGSVFQTLYSHGLATGRGNVNILITEASSAEPNRLRTVFMDADDSPSTSPSSLDVSLSGFPDNTWHLYTLTVKSGKGARVYLDGTLRASNSSLGGAAFTPSSCLFLGYYWSKPVSRSYGGIMDDLRVYSRELDINEIAAIRNLNPSAAILAPSTNTTVMSSQSLVFQGTGTDPEGATLRYVWADTTNSMIAEGSTTTGRIVNAGQRALKLFTFDAWGAHAESSRALTVIADDNSNGLPDTWESLYWSQGGCGYATNDSDNDGQSNYLEWLAGTDPTNADSVLKLSHAQTQEHGIRLGWTAETGKDYVVLSSTNLCGPFTTSTPIRVNSRGTIYYTNNITGPCGFYRLQLTSTTP